MPKVANKVRKHRKFLSLTEKLELVAFFKQQNCSIRKLAKHFNIGKTQAGDIIRNQQKYYELFNSEVKESPGLGGPETVGFQIDKRVYDWYLESKRKGTAVTGPLIQQMALETAKSLGNNNFKASSGWLRRFQLRHNIILKQKVKIEGEPDTNPKNIDEWKIQLSSLLSDYSSEDIYCADETGLFFQGFPDETLSLKDETCSCGKLSSQRLTVLLCASMTGMKECPLVITSVPMDKVDFDDFDPDSVQCNLESNSLSWMTRSIMAKWLEDLDQRMMEQNRKIILFLKGTPAHCSPALKNVKIIHFPPNLYTESQPMNHGIIHRFKIHYRHLMLERFVMPNLNHEEESSLEDIDVSKAVSWIKDAWENVNTCVIQRSFKSSYFESFTPPDTITQSDNKATLNDVAELLYACDSDVNATEYVNIDANLTTEGEDEIVEIFADGIGDSFIDSNEEMPTEECEDTTPNISSYAAALRNLKQLQRFYVSRNDHDSMTLVGQLIMHNEDINDCIINNGEDC